MMGYMYNEEKTVDTLDDEGFLKTGDIGEVDKEGFLFITGRIKEMIITAGGENMAPVILEEEIKKQIPGVANCMMIGDKQKYLIALLTLKLEPNPKGGFTDKLTLDAAKMDSKAQTVEEVLSSDVWKSYLDYGIRLERRQTRMQSAACSRP